MSRVTIGIDNGLSGGMCAICNDTGNIIASAPMPTQPHKKKNEVNVKQFFLWLEETLKGDLSNGDYCIEEPGGSKSAQAAKSMAGSFHCLRGMFECNSLPYTRVTPREWQKVMLGKIPKGQTKKRAYEVARGLTDYDFPTLRPTGKVIHDGIVDAYLIAEWHRTKNN